MSKDRENGQTSVDKDNLYRALLNSEGIDTGVKATATGMGLNKGSFAQQGSRNGFVGAALDNVQGQFNAMNMSDEDKKQAIEARKILAVIGTPDSQQRLDFREKVGKRASALRANGQQVDDNELFYRMIEEEKSAIEEAVMRKINPKAGESSKFREKFLKEVNSAEQELKDMGYEIDENNDQFMVKPAVFDAAGNVVESESIIDRDVIIQEIFNEEVIRYAEEEEINRAKKASKEEEKEAKDKIKERKEKREAARNEKIFDSAASNSTGSLCSWQSYRGSSGYGCWFRKILK